MSDSFFGLFGCLKKSNISKDVNGRTVKNNPLKPIPKGNNAANTKGGRVQPQAATSEGEGQLCSECKQPLTEKDIATEDFDSKKPTDYGISQKKQNKGE